VEVTKKDRGHGSARDEVRPPALRPVLLQYAIARNGEEGLRLLHIPLGFNEEALLIFSSWEAAQNIPFRRFSTGIGIRGNAQPANSSPYSLVLTWALSMCCSILFRGAS
jgi:hypothetical protein